MNEIQIISDYNPFVITGTVLSALWASAYVLSGLIQWAWAWVDETEVSKGNWIVGKLSKQPTHGWVKENKYWMYYKYDKDGKQVDCTDGIKLPIDYWLSTYFFILPLIWFSMLCLNFWYMSMWFAMAYGLAFTMRMARRGQKLLTKHIADKDAHK